VIQYGTTVDETVSIKLLVSVSILLLSKKLRVNLRLDELRRVFATLDALAAHSPDALTNFGRIFSRPDGDQEMAVQGDLTVQLANHLQSTKKKTNN